MTNQPQLFISYSRKDKSYVDELTVHIAPLRQKFEFNLWIDEQISAGDSWKAEIEAALKNTNIAVLLISADYLASPWISEVELPRLLEQADKGDTRVIPVILRPSAWAHTPLAYFQTFPRDATPLTTLPQVQRDRAWAELYEVLEAELHRLTRGHQETPRHSSEHRSKTESNTANVIPKRRHREIQENIATQALLEGRPPTFFISHAKGDGDFAENLQGRLKENGMNGWIDTDVLEAGVDWRMEIDEAILGSRALILILSPASKNSEYVTYEWAFALGSGLRIVPLMLKDTSIHPRLEAFQYLDFTNRRARPWERLFTLLKGIPPVDTESQI